MGRGLFSMLKEKDFNSALNLTKLHAKKLFLEEKLSKTQDAARLARKEGRLDYANELQYQIKDLKQDVEMLEKEIKEFKEQQ